MDLYIENVSEFEDNNQNDDLYENEEGLKREHQTREWNENNTNSELQKYKQSSYDRNNIENVSEFEDNNQNDALYENEGGLKREHQTREWNENNTNSELQKYKQSSFDRNNIENSGLTIIKTSRRIKGCCCFLGFVLGCVFATSVCVVLQYLLLPLLESSIHETLQDVKIPSICSDNWMLYKEHCYYLSTYNKSWDDAQEICKTSSSYLTDVNDRQEADWLTGIVRQNINASSWIGGKVYNNTIFKWYNNKDGLREINFTDWAPDQPSFSEQASFPEQNCIQMWKYMNYKWDNEFCRIQKRFVCKRSK